MFKGQFGIHTSRSKSIAMRYLTIFSKLARPTADALLASSIQRLARYWTKVSQGKVTKAYPPRSASLHENHEGKEKSKA